MKKNIHFRSKDHVSEGGIYERCGHAGRVTLPMALCFAMVVATSAPLPLMAADGVGFREIGGTNVTSGTVTIDGSLKLSPEATYMKTGAGTLEIPSASIDSAAPYRIDVVAERCA